MLQLSFYPQEEDGVTEKNEFWDWAHSSVAEPRCCKGLDSITNTFRQSLFRTP